MHFLKIIFFFILCLAPLSVICAQNIENLTIITLRPQIPAAKYTSRYIETSRGQEEKLISLSELFGMKKHVISYQLYMPKNYSSLRHYPLVVLLHDSDRTGKSVTERWQSLADEVGLILAGPNAINGYWLDAENMVTYADLIEKMVNDISNSVNVDTDRVYLFGHSNGGMFATLLPYYKPDLFTAVAVHGASVPSNFSEKVSQMENKIPIIFQVGTDDMSFPIHNVKQSAVMFAVNGHPTQLNIYNGHNHWYYTLAPQINSDALMFMLRYKK